MTRLLKKLVLTLVASTIAFAAVAQQSVAPDKEKRIRESIQSRTGGKVNVDSVSSTPVPGIYAVASDGEIFYTEETGRYSFVNGALIYMQTQQDLTSSKLDKLNTIDFAKLPLKQAIKEVHGNGSRSIAVFEDPNCPICRVFTKFLDQVEDVTIYRFMYPVISPQSEGLARAAWCSSDRAGAWKSIMNGARPPQQTASCDTAGLASILQFGEKYKILNTPTVVLASGKRLVGATPPEQFLEELNAGGRVK